MNIHKNTTRATAGNTVNCHHAQGNASLLAECFGYSRTDSTWTKQRRAHTHQDTNRGVSALKYGVRSRVFAVQHKGSTAEAKKTPQHTQTPCYY